MIGLEERFSDDVHLRDWELTAEGKSTVLEMSKNIFEQVRSINVKPLRMFEDSQTVISEIELTINGGDDIILVVDIISFDKDGTICATRAYKG